MNKKKIKNEVLNREISITISLIELKVYCVRLFLRKLSADAFFTSWFVCQKFGSFFHFFKSYFQVIFYKSFNVVLVDNQLVFLSYFV